MAKKLVIKPTKKNSLFWGVLSGLVTVIIGAGGVIRGITLPAFNLK